LGGDRDGFLWGLDRDLSPVFWTYFGGRTAEGLYGLAAQGRVVYAGGASHVVPLRGLLATQDPPTHWPLCEGSLLNADAFDGGGYNGGQPACGGSADALLLSVYDDT
jgi:hypothetical protein